MNEMTMMLSGSTRGFRGIGTRNDLVELWFTIAGISTLIILFLGLMAINRILKKGK
jgi:hypothetical protein